jgi:hypothetical protein
MFNYFAILSFIWCGVVRCQEGTIVAFGDWGFLNRIYQIEQLNIFLTDNIRSGDGKNIVCLLGDNFYPYGIDPLLGYNDPHFELFSKVLAKDLNTTFLATIGNHDYIMADGVHYQIDYTSVDRRWLMGGRLLALGSRPVGTPPVRPVCFWQIDSVRIEQSNIDYLDEHIPDRTCTFRVIISHYPVFTFGQYQEDGPVNKFQSLILPILHKHKIHLFLSGHEHNAQLISHPSLATKFVIAGSPIDVRPGFIRRDVTFDAKRNTTLEWFHDSNAGIVSRIKYNTTTLQVEFVDIWTQTVLTTTIVDA